MIGDNLINWEDNCKVRRPGEGSRNRESPDQFERVGTFATNQNLVRTSCNWSETIHIRLRTPRYYQNHSQPYKKSWLSCTILEQF